MSPGKLRQDRQDEATGGEGAEVGWGVGDGCGGGVYGKRNDTRLYDKRQKRKPSKEKIDIKRRIGDERSGRNGTGCSIRE